MGRQHFHTFDALRFSSFLLVFLHHLPKTGNIWIDFFLKSGGIGVSFFFVLSGFLITYILLYEKKNRQTISLKKFFIRRILRIWPLFYLMIAFAFLSPYLLQLFGINSANNGYKPNLLVSMLFVENYRMMLTDTFPDGAPLRIMWTLCIEEHFYLLWGILLYFISVKNVPLLIFAAIVIANIARPIYSTVGIKHLDVFSNFDYFAFGALPAYILLFKNKFMVAIDKIPVLTKHIFLLLTTCFVFIIPNVADLDTAYFWAPTLFCLLFSTLILFTLSKNNIYIQDDLWYSRLGKYTYGLYLYHTIVLLLALHIFKPSSIISWCILTLISLIITCIISSASYHLFEKQFLKLKRFYY